MWHLMSVQTFPPIQKFRSSFKSARACGSKKLLYLMSVLILLIISTLPTFFSLPPFLKFLSLFKLGWTYTSEKIWHMMSACLYWHSLNSQHSWHFQHSWHSHQSWNSHNSWNSNYHSAHLELVVLKRFDTWSIFWKSLFILL